MGSDPFGKEPRDGRLHRALVYFGLREDPASGVAADAEVAADACAEAPPRVVDTDEKGAWRRALAYFGLIHGDAASRYGSGMSSQLDRDVDDLRRRIADLEEELHGRARSSD